MNYDREEKKQQERNIIQIPRFMSTIGEYPMHFGEDPGHVAEDSIRDDNLESLT
ncbi:MAG: hypothetical protein ACOZCL_08760 [Bacillota bacterium]